MTRFSVHWLLSWSGIDKKASDQYETNIIHTVHQRRGETTSPQEYQKEPPPSSTILGDEGGCGKGTTLPHVVQTPRRPYVVLWSEEARKIILIELMVPWEDGCEEAYERKATKGGCCGSRSEHPMKVGHH